MISAGRPAVAANAAANAIVASAPIAPSYWLPTTTGTLRARQRSRIRRDSVNPVRAVLTLTDADRALLERAVDVREADAALVAAERHGPALGEAQPPGAVLDRDRLLDRPHAELDERVAGPHARRRSSSPGWRRRRGRRPGSASRIARTAATSSAGARPTLTLNVVHAEALVDLRRASSAIAAGSPNETMCAAATSSAKPPSSVWHGQPRIWPTRSQTARSTAPRAT